MLFFWVFLAAAVAVLAHIRFSSSDPARWHVDVTADADKDLPGGVLRVIDAEIDSLARLDVMAKGTPRTSVLAGSAEVGHVTYITRSAVFGFPDYTTVQQDGVQIKIYARLRFGRSDFGVNRARVERWLADLAV